MATSTKVRIQKAELANATISTTYGRFKFDGQGIARVPIELARELLATHSGFTVIDDSGNPIDLPDDDNPTIPSGDNTLSGGGVYTVIDGGYVVEDDTAKYTLIGSSVENVFVKDGKIGFSDGINPKEVHVMGVIPNSTIAIGENTYVWMDEDNNAENGLELVYVAPEPTIPGGDDTIKPEPITLPGGGKYATIEGGYVLYTNDDTPQYTLTGGNIGVNQVSIKDGSIEFSNDIDTSSIHLIGVTENSTIQIGDQTYKWINTDENIENGLELVTISSGEPTVQPEPITLPGGGTYSTIEGGYVLTDGNAQFTLSGDTLDTQHISIKDGQLNFVEGVDTNSIHALGVEENSTLQIGNTQYKWVNTDNNAENGLELESIQPEQVIHTLPGGGTYSTIEGGYVLSGDGSQYTLMGGTLEHVSIKDGKIEFDTELDTSTVHLMGAEENSTIKIGDTDYKWINSDNNAENGLELVAISSGEPTVGPQPTIPSGDDTIKPEPITLPGGGTYSTIEGGYVLTDGTVQFTLMGDTLDKDNIFIEGGQLRFTESVNPAAIHVKGVEAGSTVTIGNSMYKFEDTDNISADGLELVLVSSGEQTVGPQPTVPSGESISGFSYDFNGKSFEVSGGLREGLSESDLNENAVFDGQNLTLNSGIVDNLNDVHIQGLDANTTVNVDGENFTLEDTDNNPENGLELIGKTSDLNGWKYTNRSSGKYEPAVWKHYSENVEDIVVIGCIQRPTLTENTLSVEGDDIKIISNETENTLTINSVSITGKLTKGVSWSVESGIKIGIGTGSYILYKGTLFVPKAFIQGVISTSIQYELTGGVFTLIEGELDVPNVIVKGVSISSIVINNKNYYVNIKTGKLVPNAWQKRKS